MANWGVGTAPEVDFHITTEEGVGLDCGVNPLTNITLGSRTSNINEHGGVV